MIVKLAHAYISWLLKWSDLACMIRVMSYMRPFGLQITRLQPILIYPKLEHTLHPLLRLRESGGIALLLTIHSPLSRTIYLPTNT
jgi:hypothetical protein